MKVDPVKMTKKTVEIDGGRKLFSYEFEIEEAPAPAPPAEEEGK